MADFAATAAAVPQTQTETETQRLIETEAQTRTERQTETQTDTRTLTQTDNEAYFSRLLRDRQVHHPSLPQDEHRPKARPGADTDTGAGADTETAIPTDTDTDTAPPFCFVIGADTQLGMESVSAEWDTELAYCARAVAHINAMQPRPAFVVMCGDLVDMHPDLFPHVGAREDRLRTQMVGG
jgi:hypothetical protein